MTIVHISEVNKIFSKYELPQQTLVCIIFNKDIPFSNLKKNIDIPIIKLNGHFFLVLKAVRNIFEVFFMKLHFFEKRLQKAQIKQASKTINAYFIGGKKDYILSISENMG